jgi:hypothetical protein
MAAKKPVIANVARPQGFKDDIGKSIVKGAKKGIKKKVSKAMNDVVDPKFGGKVYDPKGGLTKEYKDYVLRNNKGRF